MTLNLVVPNGKKSLADGAIEPWAKSKFLYYAQTLSSLSKHFKIIKEGILKNIFSSLHSIYS